MIGDIEMTYELLTAREVAQKVRLNISSIYRLMRSGHFPTAIKVGPAAVRWRRREIEEWLDSRPRATGETGKAKIA